MKTFLLFFLGIILAGGESIAQTIPSDKEELESGAGAGSARYADLNGYPGPKHILDLQDTLKLTAQQKREIQSAFNEMNANAIAKGRMIVEREQKLEALFKNERATEKSVVKLTREIGILRGELRAVHINAHLKAKTILTEKQTMLYNVLRHGSKMQNHEAH